MSMTAKFIVKPWFAKGILRNSLCRGPARWTTSSTTPRPMDKIPGPEGLPFIGIAHKCRRGGEFDMYRMHEVLPELHRKFGPIVKMDFGMGTKLIFLSDPKDFEIVMAAEGQAPTRYLVKPSTKYRKITGKPVGFLADGPEWKKTRSAVNKEMLRPKSVVTYLTEQSHVADSLVQVTRKARDAQGQIQDFLQYLQRYALEAVGIFCYDTRFGMLDHVSLDPEIKTIIDHVTNVFEDAAYLEIFWPFHKHGFTKKWKDYKISLDILFDLQTNFHREAVNRMNNKTKGLAESDEDNFLRRVVKYSGLSDQEISLVMGDLLLGGIETTAYTLAFALFDLARHPDIQEKLHQHVTQIMGNRTLVTKEDVDQMQYLKAFVKESMRLTPISRSLLRIPERDVIIQDYLIPAKTWVLLNTLVSSHHPDLWKNADKLVPERWLRGESQDFTKMASLPFGHGVRGCLGRRLAEQEMYLCLTKLVTNFKIECLIEDLELETFLISKPTQPIHLKFTDRT